MCCYCCDNFSHILGVVMMLNSKCLSHPTMTSVKYKNITYTFLINTTIILHIILHIIAL